MQRRAFARFVHLMRLRTLQTLSNRESIVTFAHGKELQPCGFGLNLEVLAG